MFLSYFVRRYLRPWTAVPPDTGGGTAVHGRRYRKKARQPSGFMKCNMFTNNGGAKASVCLQPVASPAAVGLEGHLQGAGVLHLLEDYLLHAFLLFG